MNSKHILSAFCFVLMASLSSRAGAQQSGWSIDHTGELRDDIETGQLQAKTYYVRGQVRMAPGKSTADDTAALKYYWPSGSQTTIQILGATPNENYPDGRPKPRTRIVHGVLLGEDDIMDVTSGGEHNWYGYFPTYSGYALKYVQFPFTDDFAFETLRLTSQSTTEGATSKRNWPTASLDGEALEIAEAFDGGISGDPYPDYRWARASDLTSISPTTIKTTRPHWSGVALPSASLSDAYALTFHSVDFNCSMTKVSSMSYDAVTQTSTWNLADNPWLPTTYIPNTAILLTGLNRGEAILTSNSNAVNGQIYQAFRHKQRFTVMNAPQFLRPGKMVINLAQKRLYFFMPTSPAPDFDLGELDVDKGLEVSAPKADGTSNLAAPIAISGDSTSGNIKVEVKNVMFGTGRGLGINIKDISATGSLIKDCIFRNQGHQGINFTSCRNVKVEDSLFEEGYRGHITINAGLNLKVAKPEQVTNPKTTVTNLTDEGMVIENCKFDRSGVIWPYNSALEMVGFNIGTDVTDCTFTNTSGMCIWLVGAKNMIVNNTFTNCLKDTTDLGCVQSGRSLIGVANQYITNTFTNIKWPARTTQVRVTDSHEDDVSGIMLDDYVSYQQVMNNGFYNCNVGIVSNGGRYNLFHRNFFSTGVLMPLRTAVGRGSFNAMRLYHPTNVGARSGLNQRWIELKNLNWLYSVNASQPIFSNTAWSSALKSGAASATYNTGGAKNDLENLVNKITAYANDIGLPNMLTEGTVDRVYCEIGFVINGSHSTNSAPYFSGNPPNMDYGILPGITVTVFEDALDWFYNASTPTVGGYDDRWMRIAGDITYEHNLNNTFVWNELDFSAGVPNPAANTTTANPYFTAYHGGTGPADPVGYRAKYVPDL